MLRLCHACGLCILILSVKAACADMGGVLCEPGQDTVHHHKKDGYRLTIVTSAKVVNVCALDHLWCIVNQYIWPRTPNESP